MVGHLWSYPITKPMNTRSLLLSIVAAILAGCTTTKFLPYSGQQQDWPTAPGSLTEERDGIPVFHGLPPRKYDVLGQLDVEQMHLIAPSTLGKAAAETKRRGGDAVVVLSEGSRLLGMHGTSSGTVTRSGNFATYGGTSQSQAQYSRTATVVIIKFRP